MKLGEVQKLWVENLRKHPERQTSEVLGFKDKETGYKACCLGELLLCKYRLNKKKMPFDKRGNILSDGDLESLIGNYKDLGLKSSIGHVDFVRDEEITHDQSLAEANDSGFSWKEIAEFIEKYPEKVFTKSV